MILCINIIGGGIPSTQKGGRRCKTALRDLRERRSEALRGGDPRG